MPGQARVGGNPGHELAETDPEASEVMLKMDQTQRSKPRSRKAAPTLRQPAAGNHAGRDELVRLLLNSTGEGIYGVDMEGNCTFANPACAKLLGFESVDELLGRQMHNLVHHTRANGVHYPVEECRIYQAFRAHEGAHVDDEVMFRADGKPFRAEYWSYPVERDGELVGCVVTFVDISERRRNEELVAEQAAALAEVARFPDMNPGPVLRVNLEGIVRLANKAARGVFGAELVGCRWQEVCPDIGAAWPRILEATEPVGLERRLGDREYVFTHRRDIEGDQVFIFGTDITSQKRAEDALRIYGQMVSASTDFLSFVDKDYVYRAVSDSYLKAFGKAREEIVGQSVAVIVGKEVFETQVKHYMDRALAGEHVNYQSSLDFSELGGRYLDVHHDPFRDAKGEVSGLLVNARDITEQKEAEQDLRQADDLVRMLLNSTGEGIYGIDLEGNCTFANPACARLLGFGSVDELLGRQMHKLVHHTHSNGAHYPVEECRIYQAFREHHGTHVDDEVMFRADGTPFPTEYWSYPVERDGELVGCVVTFVDISERRRAEEELRQTEKMAALGKLSAGLAHELNNPAAAGARAAGQLMAELEQLQLAAVELARAGIAPDVWHSVTGWAREFQARAAHPLDLAPLERSDREENLASWLEARGMDDGGLMASTLVAAGAEIRDLDAIAAAVPEDRFGAAMTWLYRIIAVCDLADVALRSTRSISDLVNVVKSYSYMDQAPTQFIDIHSGIEDTVTILGHKLKRGVEVVRQYDRALPRVSARGSELNQVWTNLIDNAIDAMGERGGVITIRTYQEDGHAVVEIADDGPGIPEAIQPQIFDPFFTTKEVGKGTGLGLDVARRIVTARSGGQIDLRSRPGETVFRVRIPVGSTHGEVE